MLGSYYFVRIIDRIDERQCSSPGVTDDNRALDTELLERVVKQTRLNFDGGISVLRPLAETMARTIKSDGLMMRRKRTKQTRPIPI